MTLHYFRICLIYVNLIFNQSEIEVFTRAEAINRNR
jgi:hypothetical protein